MADLVVLSTADDDQPEDWSGVAVAVPWKLADRDPAVCRRLDCDRPAEVHVSTPFGLGNFCWRCRLGMIAGQFVMQLHAERVGGWGSGPMPLRWLIECFEHGAPDPAGKLSRVTY